MLKGEAAITFTPTAFPTSICSNLMHPCRASGAQGYMALGPPQPPYQEQDQALQYKPQGIWPKPTSPYSAEIAAKAP